MKIAAKELIAEYKMVKYELEQLKKDHDMVLKIGVEGQRKLNARQFEEYKIEIAAEKAKRAKLIEVLEDWLDETEEEMSHNQGWKSCKEVLKQCKD